MKSGMKNTYKNIYTLIIPLVLVLVTFALGSCVYDYTPKDDEIQGLETPLVVIDGDIIAGGTTRVKISLTQPLLQSQPELPLGSSVWIESEDGQIINATPTDNLANNFEANTTSVDLQKKYRLCVSIPNRGEYISEFKNVLISPPIDSITYSLGPDRNFARIEVTTHNNAPGKLYCKWNYYENWESDALYPSELDYDIAHEIMSTVSPEEKLARQYCFSEAISLGTYIANTEKLSENILYKSIIQEIDKYDYRLSGLYAITVTQTALDKEAFIYWESMRNNTNGTGGIFSPQPSEVRGNITCTTRPEEIVVGYVNVTTATQLRKFINWTPVRIFATDCVSLLLTKRDPLESDNNPGNTLWNAYYSMGYRPIQFDLNTTEKAFWALHKCTDCRIYSNSTKPDFWPN